jgi:hypothetical protein
MSDRCECRIRWWVGRNIHTIFSTFDQAQEHNLAPNGDIADIPGQVTAQWQQAVAQDAVRPTVALRNGVQHDSMIALKAPCGCVAALHNQYLLAAGKQASVPDLLHAQRSDDYWAYPISGICYW